MAAFDRGLCLTKESIEQSTLDRNVLVRSKSKWKSSSETLESPTNSSDMISFSADDATSESEFDEHPYSMPKRVKTLNFNYCKQSIFQPKFATSNRPRPKSKKIISEDIADSFCWKRPKSNIGDEIIKCSSKTRRRGSKCESKNAVMARLNRLKKKKFIEDLENRNAKLEAENELLKKALAKRLKEVSLLKRETVNLHSVIKNSTEIGSLLQCVQKNTNLRVTSSLLRNESNPEQHLQSNKPMSVRTMSDKRNIGASGPVIGEHTENDEALVAAVVWGMALHLVCQPYKQNSSNDKVSITSNKSDFRDILCQLFISHNSEPGREEDVRSRVS